MTFFKKWQEIWWEWGGDMQQMATGQTSTLNLDWSLLPITLTKKKTLWRKTVVTWNQKIFMWCTCSLQCVSKLLTVTVCSILFCCIFWHTYLAIYLIHFGFGQFQSSINTNDIYMNQSFSNWRHPHSVCCTCTIKIEPCIVWLAWPNRKFKTQSLRSLKQGHTVQILPN